MNENTELSPKSTKKMLKKQESNVPDFIQKLFRMLENKEFQNVFCWDPSGTSFLVKDTNEFSKTILPKHFKHCNFASFVRQLNKYDFHKIRNNMDENQRLYGDQVWEFEHSHFRRDRRDLLEDIKRKIPGKKKKSSNENNNDENDQPESLTDNEQSIDQDTTVAELKKVTENLQAELNVLKKSQSELESTVNKLNQKEKFILAELSGFTESLKQKDILLKECLKLVQQHYPQPSSVLSVTTSIEDNTTIKSENDKPTSPITTIPNNIHDWVKQSPSDNVLSDIFLPNTQPTVEIQPTSLSSSPQTTIATSTTLAAAVTTGASTTATATATATATTTTTTTATAAIAAVTTSAATTAVAAMAASTVKPPSFLSLNRLNNQQEKPMVLQQQQYQTQQQTQQTQHIQQPQPQQLQKSFTPTSNDKGKKKIIANWTTSPRVLLVDDDSLYRDVSGRMLNMMGCSINLAKDGLEALEKLSVEKYDLILMDIVMPKMDGIVATRNIRRYDTMTPIVSMTSNFTHNDIMEYIGIGMNDILPKPFSKNTLYDILEKHCAHLKLPGTKEELLEEEQPTTSHFNNTIPSIPITSIISNSTSSSSNPLNGSPSNYWDHNKKSSIWNLSQQQQNKRKKLNIYESRNPPLPPPY